MGGGGGGGCAVEVVFKCYCFVLFLFVAIYVFCACVFLFDFVIVGGVFFVVFVCLFLFVCCIFVVVDSRLVYFLLVWIVFGLCFGRSSYHIPQFFFLKKSTKIPLPSNRTKQTN